MLSVHALRNAPDWGNFNVSSYLLQENIHSDILNEHTKNIYLWNSVLKPNYFKFRETLSSIARTNHHKLLVDIRLKTTLYLEEYLSKIKPPYLVFISDDDDWYDYKILDLVKNSYANNPALDAITWTSYELFLNHKVLSSRKPYIAKSKKWIFDTNNYCLTDQFFKKLGSDDYRLLNYSRIMEQSYDHAIMETIYKNKINWEKIKVCSLVNKNIASYSMWLYHFININDLLEIIKICSSRYPSISNDLCWATSEIQSVLKLYKEIAILRPIL